MATVNKDFRVKNGLIVEGTTGTINGSNILTEASTTFIDNKIEDVAGALLAGASLNNIQITYDNVTNALSITAENGVADSTTDNLTEGTTNLYFTDERAQDAVGTAITGGTQTNITVTYDDANNVYNFVAENGVADSTTTDLAEGTNLYFTNQRALDATAAAYDPAGSAATAESNAIATAASDATTKANTAESNANTYTDDLIGDATVDGTAGNTVTDRISSAESSSNTYTDSLIGDNTVDGTGGNTVTDRIASAVSDLVDSAPTVLDTLNELAAALGDDPNFATTVAADIGTKVSKSGDTMTGLLTLSGNPTNNFHAATKQYVDNAVSTGVGTIDTDDVPEGATNEYFTVERAQDAVASAISGGTHANITITYDDANNTLSFAAENGVADSTTTDLAEGTNLYFTDARAVSALEAVVPDFTEIDINSFATQVAAQVSASTASTQYTAYAFAKADYRSAKFLVKVAYGAHTEVSEVLVTLDTSDNIAITEYAVVGTNGSASTIDAGINGTDVELYVTPTNNSSTVTVMGTLLK